MRSINKFYLLSLIGKYGVRLLKHSPGDLTVEISSWKKHEQKFHEIIAYLREDETIYAVSVENNIVSIRFDPSLLKNEAKVNQLYSLFERFDL